MRRVVLALCVLLLIEGVYRRNRSAKPAQSLAAVLLFDDEKKVA